MGKIVNCALKHIALGGIVATTRLGGVACAQAQTSPVEPLINPVPKATRTPLQIKAPEDWIIYDDTTYMPVIDDVGPHLAAARKVFDAKDNKNAARELRAVADELKRQAALAGKVDRSPIKADNALLATDLILAHDTVKRINASARKVNSTAAGSEDGKINTTADSDRAIDKAARVDMDRRWLVRDVTAWFPVNEEPQRLFMNAVASYAKKEYETAASDIRRGSGYLSLESNRATGGAKKELDRSIGELDMLATPVEKGTVRSEQSMANVFAKADHALALEHRSKALETWARKEYEKTGHQLKAAAFALEGAADWVGDEAKASAAASVADIRSLGDKLTSGVTWTREEAAKGLKSLGNSINALGRKSPVQINNAVRRGRLILAPCGIEFSTS